MSDTKRVTLRRNYGEFQAGAIIELESDKADRLLKQDRATLAKEQRVYGHEDEMSVTKKEAAINALRVADAAGGYREQQARAAATAALNKK